MSIITCADLRQAMASDHPPQLIDVRSPAEFAAGHIPGAVNIPMEQLESRLDDITERPVLICQGGTRAAVSAGWLREKCSTLILQGGTTAWKNEGNAVVQCTRCRWSLERQVRFGAGLMVLAGTLLSLLVSPIWVFLAMFAGAGLTFAGITDICGMGLVLARMPWNRTARTGKAEAPGVRNCCS